MPENALSCANDYFTIKDGMLYQHHVQGASNNTFYGKYTNSSLSVVLNQQPGSVKSFHSLDYEGSDSRVEGIRTVEVTGIEHAGGASHDGRYFFFEKEDMSKVIGNHDLGSWHGTLVNMKQYRNNILIHSGSMKIFNDPTLNSGTVSPSGGPTKGHGRYEPYSSSNPGNWQVGDIVTTQQQEETVNHFNSMPKDGWYVSNIETNKQKGSLTEFIEKEGKWFNYIKGTDEGNINAILDGYGGVFPQGIGIVDSLVRGSEITVDGIVYSLADGSNPNSYPDGMFFYMSEEEFNTIADIGHVSTEPTGVGGVRGNTSIPIKQYRNNILIWTGLLRVWNDPAGGGIHGRKLTGSAGGDWQVGDVIGSSQDLTLTFANSINYSLQVGDTLYFERPSEVLGPELVSNGNFSIDSSSWSLASGWSWDSGKISAISANNSPSENAYQTGLGIQDNKTYRVQFEISDYSAGRIRAILYGENYHAIMTPENGVNADGVYIQDFTPSTIGGSFNDTILFQPWSNLFTGKIDNVSVKEIQTGNVLGFNRIEGNNIQKAGVVTSLTNNTITIDNSGVFPSAQDYVLFVKNQVVNTGGLKGYYANVKFENNSKHKVEMFSVSSEVSESSK